ncbi:alpha-ketoglutarate-dependent dioxygenase AlkB family protein [Pseudoxanthomonas indica]|uniref:DNA-N1-methyladenine dioxygenase n=1 Tax=Pseudoxanthomonas indica TaxID=428993 RepID=A0A1T5LFD5_9GAMM|nr:alpha-ketoglutarate-dependent dioxygenase AlkB [Pseudoxanthomonas indica]GGD34324.1 DNA methylase [Pseudoxanthomonas indica]SKC74405.1 DNA-N1-methyladenine dioxygenase [Pseudoxanthomonas indica]
MSLPLFPSAESELALPDARLIWRPGWLAVDAADRLLTALRTEIPWEIHRLLLFGREVDSPRLSCWMGDPQARYRYSGSEFRPRPWHPALRELAERLQAELGETFNSVLANRYRDGHDSMGWHSDDEPELGPAPVIASLSLGGTRRFVLKHRRDPALKAELALDHGSLLVMAGDTQRHYRHALPRTSRPVGERINLTFRHIRPH